MVMLRALVAGGAGRRCFWERQSVVALDGGGGRPAAGRGRRYRRSNVEHLFAHLRRRENMEAFKPFFLSTSRVFWLASSQFLFGSDEWMVGSRRWRCWERPPGNRGGQMKE